MWRDSYVTDSAISLAVVLVSFIQIRFLTVSKKTKVHPVIPLVAAQAVIFGISPLYRILVDADPTVPFIQPESVTPGLAAGLLFSITLFAAVVARTSLDVRYQALDVNGREAAQHDAEPGQPSESVLVVAISIASLVAIVGTAANIRAVGGLSLFLAGRSAKVAAATSIGYLSYSPLLVTATITSACILRRRTFSPTLRLVVGLGLLLSVAAFLPQGARRFVIPAIAVPIVARVATIGIRFSKKQTLVVLGLAFLILGTIPFLRAAGAREQAGGWHVILVEGLMSPVSTLDRFLSSHDTSMPENLAYQIENVSPTYTFGALASEDVLYALLPSQYAYTPPSVHDRVLIELHGGGCVPGFSCEDQSVLGSLHFEGGFIFVAFGGLLAGWMLTGVHANWAKFRRPSTIATLSVAWVFAPIIYRAVLTPPLIWLLIVLVPTRLFIAALQTPNGARVLTTPQTESAPVL